MQNYSTKSKASSRSLPVIKLDSKAILYITDEFNGLVKYLCGKINTIEWSGILFFKSEGDIQSKDGIKITPIDIYPMDQGSAAYTEYDIGEEVFDYYEHHPKRFGMKYGHIHSHHNMDAYFSGTDMQELMDNHVNHSYYVSIIVNNRGKIVGKIAIPGERENVASSNYTLTGLTGKSIKIPKKVDSKDSVMYTIELNVQQESIRLDELFIKRVDEIMTKKKVIPTYSGYNGYNRPTVPQNWKQPELPIEYKKEKSVLNGEVEAVEVFKLCLGEDVGDNRTLPEIFSTILGVDDTDDDILFYLSQSFDSESVVEAIRNLQRDFFAAPSIDDILAFYAAAERIANSYIHGKYKKVANMMIVTIVKELNTIKEQYEI